MGLVDPWRGGGKGVHTEERAGNLPVRDVQRRDGPESEKVEPVWIAQVTGQLVLLVKSVTVFLRNETCEVLPHVRR